MGQIATTHMTMSTTTTCTEEQQMQEDLKNQMIEWKKQQSRSEKAEQFERFLFEEFPENIEAELRTSQAMVLTDLSDSDTESDSDSDLPEQAYSRFSAHTVKWVDTRVQGEEWQDAFRQVRSDDEGVSLGAPPGLDFGVVESCSDCCNSEDGPQLWNSDRFSSFSSVREVNSEDEDNSIEEDLKEMEQQISSFFSKSTVWFSQRAASLEETMSKSKDTTTGALPISLMEAC